MSGTVFLQDQRVEVLKARTKAFRFPKGRSGNPDGQSRFYHEARMLARRAAPQMMKELIELALHAEDERVKSVCLVAVLDRAGVKPIDFDPAEEKALHPKFNPRDYSPDELRVIETALRLVQAKQQEKKLPLSFGPT